MPFIPSSNPSYILTCIDSHKDVLRQVSFSSREYFVRLFALCKPDQFNESVANAWMLSKSECISSLLAGLATSADTGNEDLVIASRAAVAAVITNSSSSNSSISLGDDDHLAKICMALFHNLKLYQGQDRVIVPTLELMAYLFHIGAAQRCRDLNLRQLCLLTQKAGYKTGNVRKLEACIKVYGGIASSSSTTTTTAAAAAAVTQENTTHEKDNGQHDMTSELGLKRKEGIAESKRRLGALLVHPWPRVRNLVIDELWGLLSLSMPCSSSSSSLSSPSTTTTSSLSNDGQHVQAQQREKLLSVDWGKADKNTIKTLVGSLGLD